MESSTLIHVKHVKLENLRAIVCATETTPLATEACLRTLRYWEGEAIRITVVAPLSTQGWMPDLLVKARADAIWTSTQLTHERALFEAYHESDERYVLLLDNDVTFHGEGMIRDMRLALDGPNVYAACIDGLIPRTRICLGLAGGLPGEPSHIFGVSNYWAAERIRIDCTMLRRSDRMDDVVERFGFGPAMRRCPDEEFEYFDTGGLFMEAMRLSGYTERFVAGAGRAFHWCAMTRAERSRYEAHEDKFRLIIADHPWR